MKISANGLWKQIVGKQGILRNLVNPCCFGLTRSQAGHVRGGILDTFRQTGQVSVEGYLT